MTSQRIKIACRAAAWHLAVSAVVAVLISVLVFFLWFPSPYATMVGGVELFVLLTLVDVVCGPLLTLVMFNPEKSRRELTLDLGIVAALQLCALVYGLHSMWQARPVYLAYEIDRFYAITYANIDPDAWNSLPSNVPPPGWRGPQMLATRVARPGDADYLEQVQISLAGLNAVYRPDRWMPYERAAAQLKERARPLGALYDLHPNAKTNIDHAVNLTGKPASRLRWLPVQVGKTADWVVLLDTDSVNVLGFLPLSGF